MGGVVGVAGSSHREAPGITGTPKVDATDFYMFRSYEPGREAYVTLIANYVPLQDPYGGPNYFTLDPDAIYSIHVDSDGDAVEDITFAFRPAIIRRNVALSIDGQTVAVPVINVGPIGPGATDTRNLNVEERYQLFVLRGRQPSGLVQRVVDAHTGSTTFMKPVDNIGAKSAPNYESYAAGHVRSIDIPGCDSGGRVFVGQRKDPFVVNLGEIFDLVNVTNPLGSPNAEPDDLTDKNITSFILEVPISCVTTSTSQPIIGAWTTAGVASGPTRSDIAVLRTANQVSRLGHPLVNEVVIGLKDKDAFNASHPSGDSKFATYLTHPTLPAILELLFGPAGVKAPTAFPRADLQQVFLTGVTGLNQPQGVQPAEVLRLNTSIMPTARNAQHRLGVLGGDTAGFPNGRRPGDDVVDAALRVVMGVLLPSNVAPSGSLPFTDGAYVDSSFFGNAFPYLGTPLPGSPN